MEFLEESLVADQNLQRQQAEIVKKAEENRKHELRRTRTFAAVIGVAFLVALVAAWIAWKQQKEAKKQEEAATHQFYAANMNLAQEAYANDKYGRAYELLTPFLPSSETKSLSQAREFYWYYLWRSTQQETLRHESSVLSVAFSPDGKTLASAGGDPIPIGKNDFAIRLWFAATDEDVARQRNQ